MENAGLEDFAGTDRYIIQRRLGRGGFGVVYQAVDRQQNTVIAIKTLHKTDTDALYRFKREFRGLADISHPNLVALHDLVSDGQQWFFTMELVAGVDFLTYVGHPSDPARTEPSTFSIPETRTMVSSGSAASGSSDDRADTLAAGRVGCRCDPERLRAATRQLAEGLCALHQANVLHRDIKPFNVLVTGEGRVVILDFGLMADIGKPEPDQTKAAAGTPAYMSPEQSAGLPADQAADWYAVGVMLFEALTGQRPFLGTTSELVAQKQQFDAPAPSALASGLPEDLEELCRDLLQRDRRMRPNGLEVLRRLGAPEKKDAADQPPGAPFVGRRLELAALHEALDSVRGGRTIAVCVHGTSGIGKSALVNRFLERLRHNSDVVTLDGRCFDRESVPYKAFDRIIDLLTRYLTNLPAHALAPLLPPGLSALSRLFPILRDVEIRAGSAVEPLEIAEPHELRQRALRALRELLARLAECATPVLFIDDLQWGDLDSAVLLSELLQPPNPPPLLLIAGYRREEAASPLVQSLLKSVAAAGAAVGLTELALDGLSQSESQRLALEIAGGSNRLNAARAAAIARDSAGNPLFIGELVRAPETASGSSTLDQVIHARVSRLPDPARRLLEVVAVAGQPIELELAKQAARHQGPDYEVMALLRVGRLVRTRTAGDWQEIEAYHNRIRETVSTHLAAETLRSCHGRLAEVLEASGRPDPERLAVHFKGAGDRGKAFRYATAAADQAADALAFERAARVYRFALELETHNGAEQRTLRGRLGDALSNAGRGAEAAAEYLLAAGGSAEIEQLEYRRRAAAQLLMSGHLERGISVLRDVLAASGMRLASTPLRAMVAVLLRRVLINLRGIRFRETDAGKIPAKEIMRIDTCWSVAQGLALVDTIRAADFQMRHLLLALKAGEPYRVSRALAVEAGYHAIGGGRSRVRTQAVLQANHELAEKIHHQYPHALGLATMVEGMAAFLEGHWKLSRDIHARAESILRERCRGVAWELATARLMWSVALFFLGELAVLADRLPALLKEAEARGDLYEATDLRIRISHANWLAADDPEMARLEVSQAIAHWPREEFYIQHWWSLIANVEISLYSGQGLAAWELVNSEWPRLKRSFLMRIQYILIESLYHRGAAALAVAAGSVSAEQRKSLLKVAEADARMIRRENMEWSNPLAQLMNAAVSAAHGNRAIAAELLGEAQDGFKKADMALYAAATRWRRGELLGGPEGEHLIRDASEWMLTQRIRNPRRMTTMIAPGTWV